MSPNSSKIDEVESAPSPDADSAVRAESAIYFRDVAPAIEFACWVVVVLAPFLRWINGAAVTDDQFVIQVTLFSLAAAGAIGLRLYNWLSDRNNPENSVPPRIADDAPDRA